MDREGGDLEGGGQGGLAGPGEDDGVTTDEVLRESARRIVRSRELIARLDDLLAKGSQDSPAEPVGGQVVTGPSSGLDLSAPADDRPAG